MRLRSFLAGSFLAGLAVLGLIVAGGVSAAHAARFDTVYIFGDSLTDVGNFLVLTSSGAIPGVPPQPLPPHYVTGRRSNGPIWPDYFMTISVLAHPGRASSVEPISRRPEVRRRESRPYTRRTSSTSPDPPDNSRSSRRPFRIPTRTLCIRFGSAGTISTTCSMRWGRAVRQTRQRLRMPRSTMFLHSSATSRASAPRISLLFTVPDLGKTPEITEFYSAYEAAASELADYYDRLLVSSVAAEAAKVFAQSACSRHLRPARRGDRPSREVRVHQCHRPMLDR